MRERIGRLAKGITELETPVIKMAPEFLKLRIPAGTVEPAAVELGSANGISIKGACFTDCVRAEPDRFTFAGRRIHINIRISAKGLSAGDRVTGGLDFITNAGEFKLKFEAVVTEPESKSIPENINNYVNTALYYAAPVRDRSAAQEKDEAFPEDEDMFREMLTDLIHSRDESKFAFRAYSEAIRRQLNVTYLYESYVEAYPYDCDEEMPREVLLYFYYDNETAPDICEKLYANIIKYQSPESELYESYAPRMSAFAMGQAISGRINRRLAVIYDSMILEGMIDYKAAKALPDIFKCHEITIEGGTAAWLTVSYPQLNTMVRAQIIDGAAYVPVYFADAKIRFYDFYYEYDERAGGDNTDIRTWEVTDNVRYTDRTLFNKPVLLKKCFELYHGHEMLMLSACREIGRAGINDSTDRTIAVEALRTLDLKADFKSVLIEALSRSCEDMRWLDYLVPADYSMNNCAYIFRAFMGAGRYNEAYATAKRYGFECADPGDIRRLTEEMIKQAAPESGEEMLLIKLSKELFDMGEAGNEQLKLLCRGYNGSIADMLGIMRAAMENGVEPGGISERILAYQLFAGVRDGMDDAFRAYIESRDYDDMIVRAYLTVRSLDHFLGEHEVDEEIFIAGLTSYLSSSRDPEKLPEVLSIALTEYYSGQESLPPADTVLCQRLADFLISRGLVFRYTKRLRKLIKIPDEISWKYYIEYRGTGDSRPCLMVRILPDDEDYHAEEMKRVFRNIYVMSTVLFTGDELHYVIYDDPSQTEPADEGVINVTKLHSGGDERMRFINRMMSAINNEDTDELRESMLSYVEYSETIRELFRPEIV